MKAAVVVFPGSNCDTDCFHALKDVVKVPVEYVWHKERALPKVDLVVIPGGFSYGDYLRTGAIARFSPVMESVIQHAQSGRAVIGICNGFQILLEAGLLPGAMLRNKTLEFVCKHTHEKITARSVAFRNKRMRASRAATGSLNLFRFDNLDLQSAWIQLWIALDNWRFVGFAKQ